MDKNSLKIVYMGTPDFAVEPLKKLVEGGYRVVAVVTMPDKPAGRGMKLRFSPVKEYALEQQIPVLQPELLKDDAFLSDLRSYKPDLQVVVAFRMLPEIVWSMPPMGTFNLHASLLPQYRGAAPIHWAVINGETETGVTTFFLQHAIDTGDLLLQEKIDIGPDETTGSVHDRLMVLGASVVCRTVDAVLTGTVKSVRQPEGAFNAAPKLFRDNTRIDWSRNVSDLHNFIRGLSPFPTAWTEMQAMDGCLTGMKILDASYEKTAHDFTYGTLVSDGKSFLKVAAGDGFVVLERFQLAGRKALKTKDFLHGFPNITDFCLA
jgi:methionyl-tRNA formyltransferase